LPCSPSLLFLLIFLVPHKFWNIYTFVYIPLYLWFHIVIEDETDRLYRNVGIKIPLHAE
jgi:hypothetical protein